MKRSMHMIQAKVLSEIVEYIQDKTGKETDIREFNDYGEGISVVLKVIIGRDYPGIEKVAKT